MIVEDEAVIGMDIKQSVKSIGCQVCANATKGEEAIKLAAELKPDLVLMDIYLDDEMDGIEAAEIIYKKYNIPVIYITVDGSDITMRKAAFANPYGYICKPFSTNDLWIQVKMAFYRMYLEKRARLRKNNEFRLDSEIEPN